MHRMRSLYVWAITNTRTNSQEHTPLVYNTFDLLAGARLTDLQLVVSGTTYMPMISYDYSDVPRIYHGAINYGWGFNSNIKSPQVSLESFENLFGYYYFNLSLLPDEIKNDSASLELHWKQTANMADANAYVLYCALFHEGEAKIDVQNNHAYLTVQ